MIRSIITISIQSCILSAIANIIAQLIKFYQTDLGTTQQFYIDWTPLTQFVIFTALNSPPNFLWQSYLESSFPSYCYHPSSDISVNRSLENLSKEEKTKQIAPSPRFSLSNTLIKFFWDQTLGASVNTILFSMIMAGLRGVSFDEAKTTAIKEFWPVMVAGWRLWPAISIINFGLVKTVEGRTLVGSVASMAWTIYLSLIKG